MLCVALLLLAACCHMQACPCSATAQLTGLVTFGYTWGSMSALLALTVCNKCYRLASMLHKMLARTFQHGAHR
jgi:hypothetical protein